jgi:nuclear pore complex protein Nup205
MAKLRDERFMFPGSLSSDSITCLDLIVVKQLSNGACLTILFKLIMAILRNESSEALRRRYVTHSVIDSDCLPVYCFRQQTYFCLYLYSQYALLLSYFQYCLNVVDPDVPTSVLQFLLLSEQDSEYIDLPKV